MFLFLYLLLQAHILLDAVAVEPFSIKRQSLLGLINLSCVESKYNRISDLNEGMLHVSMNFQQLDLRLVLLMLQCICNLSGVHNNAANLVELGCARQIAKIAMITKSVDAKRLCVDSLCHLAECPMSRTKMADHGQNVIPTLQALADINSENCDEGIRQACALTISRLALDYSCADKVIADDKTVPTIVNLCLHNGGDVEVQRIATAALCALSSASDKIAEILIENEAVKAIKTLMYSSSDAVTQCHCMQGLCMLLAYGKNVDTIVEQGAVRPLIALADPNHPTIAEWCGLAFYVLSCNPDCIKGPVQHDLVAALVNMSKMNDASRESRSDCVLALWNLSMLPDCDSKGLIPSLVRILSRRNDDARIRGDSAMALYNLSMDEENCVAMLKMGALAPLLQLCTENDSVTESPLLEEAEAAAELEASDIGPPPLISKTDTEDDDGLRHQKQCAALMARLSTHNFPADQAETFVEALIKLAKLECRETQQRVVVSLYNLSCIESVKPFLMTDVVVVTLVRLSNRPDESVRRGCAATLTNLAAVEGKEPLIINCTVNGNADTGAVRALLIISLVSSDSTLTKEICAKALFNLLHDTKGRKSMVKGGVFWGFELLAKSTNVEVTRLCATAFCNLSIEYCKEMMEGSALNALFALLASTDAETHLTSMKAVVNMLVQSNATHIGLHTKTIEMLRDIGKRDSPQAIRELFVICVTILSRFPRNCPDILGLEYDENGVEIEIEHGQTRENGLLGAMDVKTMQSMGRDMPEHTKIDFTEAYALILYRLAECESTKELLLDEVCMQGLRDLSTQKNTSIKALVVGTIRTFSCDRDNLVKLVKLDACGILQGMCAEAEASPDVDESEKEATVFAFAHVLYNLSCAEEVASLLVNKTCVVKHVSNLWARMTSVEKRKGASGRSYEKYMQLCAMAVCTLANGEVNTARMVEHGATTILCCAATLTNSVELKERCTAALRNLLSVTTNHQPMVDEGVLAVLVKLGREGESEEVEQNCASALRTLTYNKKLKTLIMESGAMAVILDTAAKSAGHSHGDEHMSMELMSELEAESWSTNARGQSREGRAVVAKKLRLESDADAVAFPVKELEVPTYLVNMVKFTVHIDIEAPELDQSGTKHTTKQLVKLVQTRMRKTDGPKDSSSTIKFSSSSCAMQFPKMDFKEFFSYEMNRSPERLSLDTAVGDASSIGQDSSRSDLAGQVVPRRSIDIENGNSVAPSEDEMGSGNLPPLPPLGGPQTTSPARSAGKGRTPKSGRNRKGSIQDLLDSSRELNLGARDGKERTGNLDAMVNKYKSARSTLVL